MDFSVWLGFALASSILLVIPGPTILTVISYSISHGNRARVPLVAAVALGDATAVLFSIVGLGVLLAKFAYLFMIVKWVGGLYLLYLGFQLLKSSVKPIRITPDASEVSPKSLFLNTYLVTALNPKGIVFFIAFLPQFIHHDGNTTFQLWVLATTFVVLAAINAGLYALFAEQVRKILISPKSQKIFHFTGGMTLSLAGVWTLLTKQA